MLRTALVIGGDTKEAQAALSQLEGKIEQSEAEARKLAAAYSAVDVSTTRLAKSQATAAAQIEASKANYAAGTISLEEYNKELLETKAGLAIVEAEHRKHIAVLKEARAANVDADEGMQQLTKGMTQQQMGAQQLAMNLGDMSTMYALGAKPQQIFASQMSQTFQAIQLMMGGTSKLAQFMMGPWGLAIAIGAQVLLPLIGNLASAKDEAAELTMVSSGLADAQSALGEMFDLSTGKIVNNNAALHANNVLTALNLRLKAMDAKTAADATFSKITSRGGAMDSMTVGLKAYGTFTESQGERNVRQMTALLEYARKNADNYATAIAIAGKASDEAFKGSGLTKREFLEGLSQEYSSVLQNETASAMELTNATGKLDASLRKAAEGHKAHKAAMSDAEKAYKRAFDTGQQFIQSLKDETDRVGLSARQVRVLELAKAQEAAATDAQRVAMAQAWSEREKAIVQQERQAKLDELKKQQQGADAEVARANREAQALGLVGRAREKLLDHLEHEAEIAPLLEELAEARRRGLAEEVARLEDLIKTKQRAFAQDQQNKDSAFYDEEAIKNAELYNEQLRTTVDLLVRMGGLAGTLGSIVAFVSGDYRGMEGPVGELLDMPIARQIDDTGKEVVTRLGDVFRSALTDHASILVGAIQTAGFGYAGASAILGPQGTSGTIGAVGGALAGSALSGTLSTLAGRGAESLFGVGAGKLVSDIASIGAPIIGSIIGSLALPMLTKLISGHDRGAAIISGGAVSGYYGDTQKFKDQAGQIANGLLGTMQQIADQFGGELDAAAMGKLSIGMRDGNYVLDPQGRGYTKTSKYSDLQSFGKDADAAGQAALKLMLERGAIDMREGALKIIKEATNLNDGLAKALQFDQIMDMLEGGSSQLVQQVKAVRAQFALYIAAMRQAGAAQADLTRVQAMQAQQVQAIIAQAGTSYRSTFYTDQQSVDFAKQQIHAVLDPLGAGAIDTVKEYMGAVEAAQKDTSEAGLSWLDTLYGLADAFGVLKQADEAAAAAAAASAAQKKAEAQAAKDQAAADKQRAIDEAKANLRQAYEASAQQRQATIDSMKQAGEGLRDVLANLLGTAAGGKDFAAAQAALRDTAFKANVLGDQDAISKLSGSVNDFWTAAQAQASSAIELERYRAEALRATQGGIGAADAAVDLNQAALDAEREQVSLLIDLNDGVMSVRDAIIALQQQLGIEPGSAGAGGSAGATGESGASQDTGAAGGGAVRDRPSGGGLAGMVQRMADAAAAIQEREAERKAERDRDREEKRQQRDLMRRMSDSLARQHQLLSRFDGNNAFNVRVLPAEDEEEDA